MKNVAFSRKMWQRAVCCYYRGGHVALSGGATKARFWFTHVGSMTQQLRVTGTLQLKVEWFHGRSMYFRSSELMQVRHTFLSTPMINIEAWVWLPRKAYFRERWWFGSQDRPVGDVLFKRSQKRRFQFFKIPGDSRLFRYSSLVSPHGTRIFLIEAWRNKE